MILSITWSYPHINYLFCFDELTLDTFDSIHSDSIEFIQSNFKFMWKSTQKMGMSNVNIKMNGMSTQFEEKKGKEWKKKKKISIAIEKWIFCQ